MRIVGAALQENKNICGGSPDEKSLKNKSKVDWLKKPELVQTQSIVEAQITKE